jgi:hypothetical protein
LPPMNPISFFFFLVDRIRPFLGAANSNVNILDTQIDDEEYVLQAAQFTFDEKKFVFKRINRTPSVSAPKKSVWKPIETTKRPPRNSLS